MNLNIFLFKNVLCMFFDDLDSGGLKELLGRDFFELKLVRVGLQETNIFFMPF